jgi:hypothetical protein
MGGLPENIAKNNNSPLAGREGEGARLDAPSAAAMSAPARAALVELRATYDRCGECAAPTNLILIIPAPRSLCVPADEFREESPRSSGDAPRKPAPTRPNGAGAPEDEGASSSNAGKAKAYKPPTDAADLSDLFVDTGQGDPLTETVIHAIPVDKPKDFFRVHPDQSYRKRCFVYTLKIEGQVEEHNYIVAEAMRDLVPEAKLCLVTTCIYRNGAPRLWLLKLPKEGEKDQMAWSTARGGSGWPVEVDKTRLDRVEVRHPRGARGVRRGAELGQVAAVRALGRARLRRAWRDPRRKSPGLSGSRHRRGQEAVRRWPRAVTGSTGYRSGKYGRLTASGIPAAASRTAA